jgi:hypothetical protein
MLRIECSWQALCPFGESAGQVERESPLVRHLWLYALGRAAPIA